VLATEMAVARVNMTALSRKASLRAFDAVHAAQRWLLREARLSTAGTEPRLAAPHRAQAGRAQPAPFGTSAGAADQRPPAEIAVSDGDAIGGPQRDGCSLRAAPTRQLRAVSLLVSSDLAVGRSAGARPGERDRQLRAGSLPGHCLRPVTNCGAG